MDQDDWLAQQFETHRRDLRAVALRMLGSSSEADDAVQEAWLRLHRSDSESIENLGGWLRTVVSRVCLDLLRARASRREDPFDEVPEPAAGSDPEHDVLLADSLGPALLVVLDTLAPAQRLAFVLHDLFAVPFDEIAEIVDRTPAATRQLASRARRRVQGASAMSAETGRRREIVAAFLAASRDGDFGALLALLDPDVVLRADAAAVTAGAEAIVRGAAAVAETFAGRARAARPVTIDGAAGLVWTRGGAPQVVFEFAFDGDTIAAIDLVADPGVLAAIELDYA